MGLAGAGAEVEPMTSHDWPMADPASRGRGGRWPILAILLLALVVRAAYVLASPPEVVFDNVDAKGYLILATNLRQRGAFTLSTDPPFVPDGVRTPLYPAFLAALLALGGDPARAIPLAQCLLDTAATALVFAIAAGVAGRRRGWLAALFYAANPISLMFVGQALTEVLLAFLVALTFALFVLAMARQGRCRAAFLALAGLLSGLCILCKPNALLMPLLLAAGALAAGASAVPDGGRTPMGANLGQAGPERASRERLCWPPFSGRTPAGDAAAVAEGAPRGAAGSPPGRAPAAPAEGRARPARDAGGRPRFLTCLRAWRGAVLVLVMAVLVLVPWVLRNRAAFGRTFLSLAFDDNLAHVSAVATLLQSQGVRTAPWSPIWEETYMQQVVAVAGARYHWAASGAGKPQVGPTGGEPGSAASAGQSLSAGLVPAVPAAPAGEARLAAAEAARRQEQVAAVAHDVIMAHPAAFVASHLLGVLRSLVPALHRYWYADLTGQPWPETASPRAILSAAGGFGRLAARLAHARARPGGGPGGAAGAAAPPALALGLLLASYGLTAVACVLLGGGLAYLWRRQPALFVSLGLTLVYYFVLPGPLAYIRFWVPATPLMAAVMALAFARPARHSRPDQAAEAP